MKRRFNLVIKKPLTKHTKRELIEIVQELDKMLHFLEIESVKNHASIIAYRHCLKLELQHRYREDEVLDLVDDDEFEDEPIPKKQTLLGYC